MCNGFGKVRAKQGLFVVERPCPTCHGRGEVIEDPCDGCRGEGRVDKAETLEVDIPPGVDTGTRIRLSGKGEAGPSGAPAGDLYIFVHVTPSNVFEREGTTLATRVPITFTTAALGGSVDIPDLSGETNTVDIPAGIQSGKQLRVRGAGMPVLQGRGRGDMVVEIAVETPTKLSKAQRDIAVPVPRNRNGRGMPGKPWLLRQAERCVQRLGTLWPTAVRSLQRGWSRSGAIRLSTAPSSVSRIARKARLLKARHSVSGSPSGRVEHTRSIIRSAPCRRPHR